MRQLMRRPEPADTTPPRRPDADTPHAPTPALARWWPVGATLRMGAQGGRWLRRRLNLRSLTTQMALGSALIALLAMLVVGVASVIAVRDTFDNVQRTQIAAETQQVAVTLGQGNAPDLVASLLQTIIRQKAVTVWTVNDAGTLTLSPPTQSVGGQRASELIADTPAIVAALRRALGGQLQEIQIAGDAIPPFALRYCAAAPIHDGGKSSGRIIGAVALASTPDATHPPLTRYALAAEQTILFTLLSTMVVAALLAVLFSRGVTRPLARLRMATARMREGDYATRVRLRGASAPDELRALALTFNEMAAALERDVGELRHQEQLRRELLANIAHELATPLTSIQGYTEALMDGVIHDTGARDETTRLIARQSARLRRLVDQLRQVALFEGGAGSLDRAPVDLASLIAETLAALAPESERQRVALTAEIAPDLPPVLADADRVTEALLNLLDNALRYTPPGGAVMVIAAQTATPNGPMAQITVADSGPGVAPADRDHIFERFTRLDASRTTATGGSGLGLAIVKSLVEAHGGAITVDERPGGGARFTFTLPFADE
ncbi:MAG TPA: ATP-binding protein [Ktedonobacterales bacterium]|nr:ATP-binding protein [Ktedonobacterales bacterium]